jgi:hypothetical protein
VAKLFNLARMTSATTGTGAILAVGAAVSGYLSFAAAGVADQDVVFYGIKDGANSEIGYGAYTASGTSLARNVIKSTNGNSTINLSGTAEVYITFIASDGGDLLPGTSNPLRGFDGPVNLQLNASVASNILTVAVKGNNGSDPSQTNPVLIPFRDSTIANGGPVWTAVTGALSINTNAAGASLGTKSGSVAFKIWIVAFNNAGTVVLGLFHSVSWGSGGPVGLAALHDAGVASTTAISGSATSSGVFYTPNGTTLTGKAFRIIGYVEYASGLTTAGIYASAPSTVQLFGPGIKKPGDVVSVAFGSTATAVSNATTTMADTGLSATITPSSAANLVLARSMNHEVYNNGSGAGTPLYISVQMLRGATSVASITTGDYISNGLGLIQSLPLEVLDAPQTTSGVTFKTRFAAGVSPMTATVQNNGATSSLVLMELMT